MASQFTEAYDDVARIGTAPDTVHNCWGSLLTYLSSHANVGNLSAVSIDDDIRSVGKQLAALFKSEPPQSPLTAIYFGLYDAVDHHGREVPGYYVSGIEHYDPQNQNSLSCPAWSPVGRYLNSAALAELKRAELATSGTDREFLAYAGQLGVALIVSRFAAENFVPHAVRVVGFDSGDYVEFSSQHAGAA